MTTTIKGGAKLGHGLTVEDGALGLGAVTDPTDAGPIVELTAKGWAEQDTTTGKNLVVLGESTWTYAGVTFKTHANASIEISGTATAEIGYANTNYLTHLSAGTYTLSGCTSDLQRLNVYKYANGSYTYIGSDMGSGYTFTLSEDTDVYVYPIVPNGKTINTIIYPQIEAGSTATIYEPYSGGAPSPSPSYPQEIRRVTGRNLLRNTATSQTVNGVTFTVNADGSVTVNGTVSSGVSSTSLQICLATTYAAGTYTLSGCPKGGSGSTYRIDARNGTSVIDYDNGTNATFSLSEATDVNFMIRIGSGYTANNLVFKPQLELGSQATSYVPYGCVGVDVHVHNLASDGVKQGVYAFGNGVYTAGNKYYVCTELMPCEVGTSYVASLTGFTSSNCFAAWFRSDGTFISNTTTTKTGDGFATVAAPDGAALFGVSFLGPSDTQVSPSDVTGVYVGEGHITTIPIPLPSRGWVAALPDGTADTLTLDGAGGYVWTLNTADVVLDGNTSSSNLSVSTSENASRATYYPYEPIGISNALFLSNRFKSMPPYSGERNIGEIWGSISAPRMWLGLPTSVTTPSEAVAYFADHPTNVLYPLATPTTEQGYVSDMPTVPVHAAISSTDLTDLYVRCCADEGAAEIASAWYNRAYAELSDAIVDLAARVAQLEG